MSADPGNRRFALRAVLWAAVAAILLGYAGLTLWPGLHPTADPGADYGDAFGGAFNLTDQDGRTVTDASLRGRPFAIFFGFTRCAEVCPTTLQTMARLKRDLGPAGANLALVFVSLDRERDTPESIGQYLTLFDTPIIGLTGSAAEIDRIVRAYHVYARKVPVDGGDYVIDHTATVFLMDRTGRFFGTLSHDEADAPKLEKLRRLMAR
ncbi:MULTISPECIES: SCO family protein [unclassified Sphingomonas]|uniref:SCO family protein n=1 Tax=unclassified Sphingomonas TaxID=196159 RepID=UPI0006F965E6|nr:MULTISPECIES: SCO family protein [unclassified Sphingomonas]KQX20889.1 electron transporter SenC [Sphingomonas sp. Root1294]KQY68735.1 electron transporter SenC [Sphingomonas sp. Root50]KRB88141.1 electron transporter SenC [Sphingomonas sp. Root720]